MSQPRRILIGVLIGLGLGSVVRGQSGEPQAAIPTNAQSLEPLPTQTLLPSESVDLPLLPDEIPLAPPTPETAAPSARYKLQLALDAMLPVLPPLDLQASPHALKVTV